MTEQQRQEWNAAIESGDEELIKRLQRILLDEIDTRIMTQDANYREAGWKV